MRLAELQRAFLESVVRESDGASLPLSNRSRISPQRSLEIYRSNYVGGRTEALRAIYRGCERLVGEQCFEEMARRYIWAHPSRSGNLNEEGERFPEFCETLPFIAEVPYLPDVARLERAWQQSFDAPEDERRVEPEDLAEIAFADPDEVALVPRASLRLIRSPYPALKLWEFATAEEGPELSPPALDAGPDWLVVGRHGMRMRIDRVEENTWKTLEAAISGNTLSEIADIAGTGDAGRLSALLGEMIERGWIAAFRALWKDRNAAVR